MNKLFSILLIALLSVMPAFGQAFTVNDIPFVSQAAGSDWAQRVVANGGAVPSANTIFALEALRTDISTLGLSNKVWALNMLVPDSLIAMQTPLVKRIGNDPWWNTNFVIGDLTVNGLRGVEAGPPSYKFLDSGIIPRVFGTNNCILSTNVGISVIVSGSSSNSTASIVFNQFLGGGNNRPLALMASADGVSQFYAGSASSGFISTNDFIRVGYMSGNRSNGFAHLFVASPTESHKTLKVSPDTTNQPLNTDDVGTVPVFGQRINGTNVNGTSGNALSMVCFHEQFTQTESSNFWVAVKTCRERLGGGTGDPVADWALRVQNYGGAAVSVTTSNALRTFLAGLDTDGLLYSIAVANAIVPDNLIAAQLPIIWQNGLQLWTNVNYAASNLTTAGLAGTGQTKYLNTSISPLAMNNAVTRGFTSNSCGVSVLVSSITTHSNVHQFAGAGTVANSFFGIAPPSATDTNYTFYSWKTINSGTDFLAGRGNVTNFTTFVTGSRTANNAVSLYFVTNGVHHLAVSGSANQTGNANTITNMIFGGSWNATLGPVAFSPYTVSAALVHSGLTQTQSSNLFVRVNALRTSLGGGNL